MGNDPSVHQPGPPAAPAVRVALHTRVSTADQNCELQCRERQEYAARQDWNVVEAYQDAMSGTQPRRPGLTRLMADAAARRFNCLLAWKLDRFGRSVVDCLNNIQTLETYGVRKLEAVPALAQANEPLLDEGHGLLHDFSDLGQRLVGRQVADA